MTRLAGAPRRGIRRRDFVRQAVAGAAIGGATVVGATSFLDSRSFAGGFPYIGVRAIFGPVSKGLPLIPVRVRDDDVLAGVPSHLDWYRFCSLQGAPGLGRDAAMDDGFAFHMNADRLEFMRSQGSEPWFAARLGQAMRASDFANVGDGAPGKWRSEGQLDSNVLRVVVIRVDPAGYPGSVREEFVHDGFLGVLAHCTHFCCTVGYRMSREAEELGFPDSLFCDCHAGTFDPHDVRIYTTPADRDPAALRGAREAGAPVTA